MISAIFGLRRWLRMEHKGKPYSIVQAIDGSWKWSVDLDGRIRSGKAPIRAAAITTVEHEIERALAPRKLRFFPRLRWSAHGEVAGEVVVTTALADCHRCRPHQSRAGLVA
jgi:hypothetical protein